MPSSLKIKMSVTLSLDPHVWTQYREACVRLGLTPSHLVEAFMREHLVQLTAQLHNQEESDHG
jgi:hypothetical protein